MLHIDMNMHLCMHMCIYIYRERERYTVPVFLISPGVRHVPAGGAGEDPRRGARGYGRRGCERVP